MRNGRKSLSVTLGALAICATVLSTAPQLAHADSDSLLLMYVDGKKTEWSAVERDGAAYVSFDTIRKLGGTVEPIQNGSQYSVKQGQNEVRFTAGQSTVSYGGFSERSELSTITADGSTLVPLEWVDELLGVRFLNDPLTGSVFVFRMDAGSRPIEVTVREPSPQPAPKPQTSIRVPVPSIPAAVSPLPAADSAHEETVGVEIVSKTWPVGGGSSHPVKLSDALPSLAAVTLAEDVLTIATTGAVTPQTFQLTSPNRLVIDLPEASVEPAADGTAEGSIAVAPDHPYISNIRYSLFNVEPSTVRIVIDLKRPIAHALESTDEGRKAIVRFDNKPFQVMIDAGHGGHDPGAISATGRYEKDVNLAVATKVQALLEKEDMIEPVMLRSGDGYTSPAERAEAANRTGVDLFVSIHANTAASASVRGTETYYWNDNSYRLAAIMHGNIVEAAQTADRKVKRERFVVIRETTMPSVLLELGFLTNIEDERRLFDEAVQQRIAEAIVESIKEYYNLQT